MILSYKNPTAYIRRAIDVALPSLVWRALPFLNNPLHT